MEYTPGTNYAVSLSGDSADEAELRHFWDALAAGGTVRMPLNKAPCGDSFGICLDKSGVSWMVNIAGSPA